MMRVTVLEHLTRVTPLAVRFRDPATTAFVSWGLQAEVYPAGQPERRTRGIVNRSDVFVFQNLPGLREVEFGAGDDAFWAAQLPRFPFVLEVRDTQGRFLPFSLSVLLPVRRLLGFAINSPLTSPLTQQVSASTATLPLFSAPSRIALDGLATLRAELVDRSTGQPAGWAVVDAKGPAHAAVTGMADENGRVMLPLPYPKPVVTLGSPGSPPMPITAQSWPIDVTVRYRPRSPVPLVPDLSDLLTQPAVTASADAAGTVAVTQATLQFGRDVVLAPLFITPAGSPP